MKVVGINIEPVGGFESVSQRSKMQLEASQLTLGNGVVLGQGEGLLGDVGNHDDRRAPSEKLSDNSASVSKRFELIHGDRRVRVTVAGLDVLLSDTVEDIGSLGGNLEEPSSGAAGGILRSEE